MKQRGRQSAASIATATPQSPVERQARPDACYSLPDEGAEVWRATLEALPAGWIGAEALPVLAAYCRTTVALRRIGQLIYQAEHETEGLDLAEYNLLLSAHAKQAQVLKTLATSLRLTPQTRLRAESAGRKADGHRPGPRLWERSDDVQHTTPKPWEW